MSRSRYCCTQCIKGAETNFERGLVDILHVYARDQRVVVFAPTKASCQRVVDSSILAQFGPRALHGDMSQAVRDSTFILCYVVPIL